MIIENNTKNGIAINNIIKLQLKQASSSCSKQPLASVILPY